MSNNIDVVPLSVAVDALVELAVTLAPENSKVYWAFNEEVATIGELRVLLRDTLLSKAGTRTTNQSPNDADSCRCGVTTEEAELIRCALHEYQDVLENQRSLITSLTDALIPHNQRRIMELKKSVEAVSDRLREFINGCRSADRA